MKSALAWVSLLLVGWVACAETASWLCVQPVVARLPYEHQVAMQQGMLGTFGRIMPVLIPLSAVLTTLRVVTTWRNGGATRWLCVVALVCIGATILTTLTINVPINTRTAEWTLAGSPVEWEALRQRWHFFQGIRGWLYMAAFVLLSLDVTVVPRRP